VTLQAKVPADLVGVLRALGLEGTNPTAPLMAGKLWDNCCWCKPLSALVATKTLESNANGGLGWPQCPGNQRVMSLGEI